MVVVIAGTLKISYLKYHFFSSYLPWSIRVYWLEVRLRRWSQSTVKWMQHANQFVYWKCLKTGRCSASPHALCPTQQFAGSPCNICVSSNDVLFSLVQFDDLTHCWTSKLANTSFFLVDVNGILSRRYPRHEERWGTETATPYWRTSMDFCMFWRF